jgi:hypothetical protein
MGVGRLFNKKKREVHEESVNKRKSEPREDPYLLLHFPACPLCAYLHDDAVSELHSLVFSVSLLLGVCPVA